MSVPTEDRMLAPADWLAALPLPAAIVDRDLRFVAVNAGFAELDGVSVAEHAGSLVKDVVPEIHEDVYLAFRSVIETGVGVPDLIVVAETPAQPGVERCWRGHIAPVTDVDGSVTSILVTVEELTAQRQMSHQLESIIEAHAALTRLGGVLVRAATREEVITSILAGSMVATGADRAALFELRDEALVLVDASGFPDGAMEALRQGPPVGSLVSLVAQSGDPFLLSSLDEVRERFAGVVPLAEAAGDRAVAAVPLATEDGVVGVLRLGFDGAHPFLPGERDRLLMLGALAAQALLRAESFEREARSRRLLEEVVRQMPVGVSITDPAGAVIARNSYVVEVYRGARESTGIEDYAAFRGFGQDGRPYGAHDWPVARSLEHGELVVGEEIEIERLDGTRGVVSISSAPVRDTDGSIIAGVGIIVDVTARRQAERTRDAFIATLSHELGTPVTSIVAGAAVLARRASLDPDIAKAVAADVAEEATRLKRLVEDVLVLSRIDRGISLERNEPVLVHHVARRVVADEAERWPSLAIELEVESGLPTASGDETYIGQVIRNLLSNAAKYGDGRAYVRVVKRNGGVGLEVSDDGPGIDQADRERVFDLFFRAPSSRSASGAGIGLFVCRQLVEAMGGTMSLGDSQTGGGACLQVWLPPYAALDAPALSAP